MDPVTLCLAFGMLSIFLKVNIMSLVCVAILLFSTVETFVLYVRAPSCEEISNVSNY